MAMASDTHLIGLNAPLKNDCMALEILVKLKLLDFPHLYCHFYIESALEKNGLALKITKCKACTVA